MKLNVLMFLVAVAAAQPASAAILELSMTGTLRTGFDQSGMFGAANTDLTGARFSLLEYFDTTKGTRTTTATADVLSGGPEFDGAPTPGWGVLTVNGASATVYGNGFSDIRLGNWGVSNSDVLDRFIEGDTETVYSLVSHASGGTLPTFDLESGFHSDCLGVDTCGGSFFFTAYLRPSGSVNYYYNYGFFDGESYNVRVLAVPEPATWAMMIVGFGLVGVTLRRRVAA